MDPTQAWNCHSTYREHAGAAVPWLAKCHVPFATWHGNKGGWWWWYQGYLLPKGTQMWLAPNPLKMSDTRFNRLLTTPFDVVASVNQAVTGDMKSDDATRFVLGFEVHLVSTHESRGPKVCPAKKQRSSTRFVGTGLRSLESTHLFIGPVNLHCVSLVPGRPKLQGILSHLLPHWESLSQSYQLWHPWFASLHGLQRGTGGMADLWRGPGNSVLKPCFGGGFNCFILFQYIYIELYI